MSDRLKTPFVLAGSAFDTCLERHRFSGEGVARGTLESETQLLLARGWMIERARSARLRERNRKDYAAAMTKAKARLAVLEAIENALPSAEYVTGDEAQGIIAEIRRAMEVSR